MRSAYTVRDGRLESSARSPGVVTELRTVTELAKLCNGITAHLDQQREEEIVMLPWVTVSPLRARWFRQRRFAVHLVSCMACLKFSLRALLSEYAGIRDM